VVPPRILIVEDEAIVAMEIERRLKKLGYTVPTIIFSGQEAVQAALDLQPDLIIMDIKLKGDIDGIEAAHRIHQQLDVPIIYLTAYSDADILARAKITEPYGYIVKPFQERDLAITVEMTLYKHQVEQNLKKRERWLTTTLTSIGEAVIATDTNNQITFMNPVAEELTGWSLTEALGQELSRVFQLVNQETRQEVANPTVAAIQKGVTVMLADSTLLITKQNTELPINDRAAPIKDEQGNVTGAVITFQDDSHHRQAEQERGQLIAKLQEAMSAVKTLRGIIPICASCKKIRDEQDEWRQLEVYIRDHTEAEFTHSLCPDCAQALYPDIFEKEE
jgi:PAS domain S-box-containing protein